MTARARTQTHDGRLALRALRVGQWIHFAALPAAQLDLAAPGSGLPRLLHGVVIASLVLAYAYALNAITDRHHDERLDKNPLAGRVECPPPVALLTATVALLGLGLAALAGRTALLAALTAVVAATVYSSGPRWKARPLVGTLLNGAIFAPLLVVAPAPALHPSLPLLLAVFLPLLFQNQLLHECADAAEDARAGSATTARVIGPRAVRGLVVGLAVGASLGALALAGLRGLTLIAVLAATTPAAAALLSPAPWPARRLLHRRAALIAGALLFVTTRIAAAAAAP